jgi:predicted acylesterase/phospholipase RssA
MKLVNVPNIKHLVIAGGGHVGVSYYGAIKTLVQKQFVSLENIETVYSTSVGGMVAILLFLHYDWDTIDNYLIHRPWNQVFKVDLPTLVRGIYKGGVYGPHEIEEILKPMLLGKDLSINITLKEFYEYNQKEIHFITTKFQHLNLCDISYKTHPDWRLLDAAYASASLPVVFCPYQKSETEIYIDGAIHMNYPVNQCISHGHNPKEILGVNFYSNEENNSKPFYVSQTNFRLFYFLLDFFLKLWERIKQPLTEESTNAYLINIFCDINPNRAIQMMKSDQSRIDMIQSGVDSANMFLQPFLSNDEIVMDKSDI